MSYFLLIWNPEMDGSWTELVERFRESGTATSRFSCGMNKSIRDGDFAIMLRKGVRPRGVIGIGRIVEGSFQAPHWNPESSRLLADYVRVEWELIDTQPFIDQDDVEWKSYDRFWKAQSGGVSVDEEQGAAVFDAVRSLASTGFLPKTESSSVSSMLLREGDRMVRAVTVQGRSGSVRDHCLRHHRAKCFVCEFDPVLVYGRNFGGLMDVHHLDPMADSDLHRMTDPVNDCVPLCPTCHRLAHYGMAAGTCRSIEELKELVAGTVIIN